MTNTETTIFTAQEIDRVIRRGNKEQLLAARHNAERADEWDAVDAFDEEIQKRVYEAQVDWDFYA